MDRRVIVLTPDEWEKRSQLVVFAEQSHQHNHYNKDMQLAIKSRVFLATQSIKEGNIEEGLEHLDDIPELCQRIYDYSCKAQEGVSDLLTVIQYKAKQEAEE